MMIEKPPFAFFEELGQYVYGYKNHEPDVFKYVGKGNGDRCWSHVIEKEYAAEDCVIIARNLEKFIDKKDWQSFLLESFLIFFHKPCDNSVSGRYKECFVMTDLSFLFEQYQSSQRNMFKELHEFHEKYEEVIGQNVGYSESRGASWYIETGAKENKYFGVKVQTKEPEITVIMKVNSTNSTPEMYNKFVETLTDNLGSKYELDTSNKNSVSFPVETLEEAVSLWKSFVG